MCVRCRLQVEVKGMLGKGSWGTVYLATWRGLSVALKTLVFELIDGDSKSGSLAAGHKAYEQALLETAVAASVDHPNVVSTCSKQVCTSPWGPTVMNSLMSIGS